jgi:pimeloyl-ACP methyl ester carboxylesterase
MFKRILGSLLILVGVLSTSACAIDVGGALPVGSLKAPVRLPQEAEFHQMISNVVMPDGQTLFVKTWQPKGEIKAVILALHGYGDHVISTFDRAASYWKQQGILTIGYDQRGFGHNPSFGYWPGGQRLVQDMHYMIERVRKSYPDQPFYIMGHKHGWRCYSGRCTKFKC